LADIDPEFEAEEEVSLFDAIEDETEQFFDPSDETLADIDPEFEDKNLTEALPDWLQFAPIGETSQEGLDWLDSFGEPDVDSWLEAEEQVSKADLPVATTAVEPEPVSFAESEAVDDLDLFEALENEDDDFADIERFQTRPLNQPQVEAARTALEIGDYEAAMTEYKSLLESGQSLSLLIAELETESARHSNIGGLQRLLGDAYMQNGQLQKAIDTYRQALDNL
jgi:tetratricopeptide (TPR) repeat protein